MYMYIFYAIYIAIVIVFIFKLSFYIYKKTKEDNKNETIIKKETHETKETPETILDRKRLQYILDLGSKLPAGSPQCTAVSIHQIEDNITLTNATYIGDNSLQEDESKQFIILPKNAGINDEDVELVKEYMKGAKKGNSFSQWAIGTAYYNGRGVSEDRIKALEWFKKAADQGNAGAQFFLGYAYYNGDNIRKNKKRGIELLKKSALQNNWNAKEYLKEMEND